MAHTARSPFDERAFRQRKRTSMGTNRSTSDGPIALLPLLKARRRSLILVAVLSVLVAASSLGQPLIVNQVISGLGSSSTTAWIVALVALLLTSALLGALQKYALTRTAERAVLDLRSKIAERMIRLPMKIYDTNHSGDMVTRISTDTSIIRAVFTGGLTEAVGGLFLIVGAIVAMSVLDPLMLVVVIAVAGGGMGLIVLASRRIRSTTLAAQNAVGKLAAGVERALSAIRTVKAARAESVLQRSIIADAEDAYDSGMRIARTEALLSPVSSVVMQAALLLVIGIGVSRVASGTMSLADLVTFVLFLFMLIGPLGRVFTSISTVRGAQGAMQRINQLMSLPTEHDTQISHQTDTPADSSTALRFEHVSFSYNAQDSVLMDLSFSVPSGMTTALVGPSGSGKTTVLSLIERFYEPDRGRVLIEGEDARDLELDDLRGRIAYVEQNPEAMSGTVRENLLLGTPSASDAACWRALNQMNLGSRFEREHGLDTVLGQRGVNLSGGEKQRLGLARALLSPAKILLLDEPTSAVDSENESAIQTALQSLTGRRALIIVAHRLTTIRQADQIIVLKDGAVAGCGSHDELLDTNPVYTALTRSQFGVDAGDEVARIDR